MNKYILLLTLLFSFNLNAEYYAIIGGENKNFHIGDSNQNNNSNSSSTTNFSFDYFSDSWNIDTTKSFVSANNTNYCTDIFSESMIQLEGGSSTYPCNIVIGFTPDNSNPVIGIDDDFSLSFDLYLEAPIGSNSLASAAFGNLLSIYWGYSNPTIRLAGNTTNTQYFSFGLQHVILNKTGRNLTLNVGGIEYFNIDLSSETSFDYNYSTLTVMSRFSFINARTVTMSHTINN